MPNKRYDAGRRFEYRVKKHLETEGWWCLRSAGSHSPADIIAIRSGEILLVQAKTDGKIGDGELAQLKALEEWTGGKAMLASRDGRKLKIEEVKDE